MASGNGPCWAEQSDPWSLAFFVVLCHRYDRVGHSLTLTAKFRAELQRQREHLLVGVVLPVVKLEDLALEESLELPDSFDVLGVVSLARSAEPAALLRKARAVMSSDGRLLLLEPYRRARWSGTLTDVVAPLVARLTGIEVNLPVAALVREAGFVIGTIERVTMPTPIVPLRSFCLIVGYPAAPNRAADGQEQR